ncbi:Inositolphosphorylceramide synthase subunit Kei1-domain-containing protein [Naematelia encephala]|uniref:Inositolphosphorylceramide synthase subunit Kei1-domain-containing protein n=1 Tax=Naematelia encephala TaxID=71784 RepID=A0A1Y2BCJ3_9TREE|nr:Inositolphosphorylceramide synthase subunit Kei1-domain-containing protein [Naematelia encephala]
MSFNVRRLRPNAVCDSFLGFLDIKLGAEIILLFGLINKAAGLYGLIMILVGGTFPQFVFYAYSVGTLFAFLWALRTVKSESANPTLLVAHLYTLDHLIQSVFHYIFFHRYWYELAHDGQRSTNSRAQQDIIDLAISRGEVLAPSGEDADGMDELRAALAGEIWRREKVYAVWVIIFGFFLKVYFILIIYSYAAHLRSSTYHTLPLTERAKATTIAHPTTEEDLQAELEIEAEREDLHDDEEGAAANGDAGKTNEPAKKRGTGDDEEFSWD